ncbi:hypothetical protein FAGKG844_690003 [Frankia sp. AgKG'84/4]
MRVPSRRRPLQPPSDHSLDLVVGHHARPARLRLIDQPLQPIRPRHFATVGNDTPASAATCPFVPPSAHANTILDRCANACDVFGRRTQTSNAFRSPSENTIDTARGPGKTPAYDLKNNWRLKTLDVPS